MAYTPSVGGMTTFNDQAARSLFLKVFSGEVMSAYERAIKVSPLLTTRTITSGKSAQFPTTGVASARYFQSGDDLFTGTNGDSHDYISTIKQSERIIYIDDLLTASCFIDQLDEAMSHYDYRSAFAKELGAALARHQDNYALYTLFSSSQDVGDVSGEQTPGAAGGTVTDADFLTSATSAMDTIYDLAKTFDEKDIPAEDRFLVMPPVAYYNLVKAGVLSVGGHITNESRAVSENGPRAADAPMNIGGFNIVVSNVDGFISANDATDATFNDDTKSSATGEVAGMRNLAAAGDAPTGAAGVSAIADQRLQAVAFHKSAAGVVKLKDITMESEYIIEKQGTLMVAKLAQGMGALRNDAVTCVLDA
tara:strand:- start:30201 stop:31292 length:1092 start_codon:yes stop_codon:yes gene_type:complete